MLATSLPAGVTQRARAVGTLLAGSAIAILACLLAIVLLPTYAGYDHVIVYGGSMGAALPAGSVAVTKPVAAAEVRVGDVIALGNPDGSSVILHRVISLDLTAAGPMVTTRGDANETADPVPRLLTGSGKRIAYHIPALGYVLHYSRTMPGSGILAAVAVLALCTSAVRTFRRRIGAGELHPRLVPLALRLGVATPGPVAAAVAPAPPLAMHDAASPEPAPTGHSHAAVIALVMTLTGLALTASPALALLSDAAAVPSNTFTADVLNPPTGLGTSVAGDSVTLTWTATVDTYATGHRVLRSTTSGSGYAQIAEITPRTTTTYIDTPGAGTWYYVIRAYRQNWDSVNSSEVSAVVALYLHNNPTPPVGDTASQLNLPLNTTAPTAATLRNYDTDRDSSAGLQVNKGGSGASESDATKYQNWRTAALGAPLVIDGNVSVVFWSGMKNLDTSKGATVDVYLRRYNGSSYTEICSGAVTDATWQDGTGSWVSKTVTITCSAYTIPAGERLDVKFIVNGSSGDDMWFAYDTTAYPSRVILP